MGRDRDLDVLRRRRSMLETWKRERPDLAPVIDQLLAELPPPRKGPQIDDGRALLVAFELWARADKRRGEVARAWRLGRGDALRQLADALLKAGKTKGISADAVAKRIERKLKDTGYRKLETEVLFSYPPRTSRKRPTLK
jgi:hypothetical protein